MRLKGWTLACVIGTLHLTMVTVSADFVLAIHGGAGTLRREALTPELEARYLAGLEAALRAGHAVLAEGGTAREAVIRAVESLEDNELFNAGRGAVFTAAGTHELDAAVMDGRDRQAGAVSMVRTVRHPVRLAEAVLETTPHVLMVGDGAEEVATAAGLERVENSWFSTEQRLRQLQRAQRQKKTSLSEDTPASTSANTRPSLSLDPDGDPDGHDDMVGAGRFGTVGAVARDNAGHLAAATSTGGMTNKRAGRIGDSPLIGAGTWADDATCAVSCTGTGEVFIRANAAADVAARMAYAGQSLEEAARVVIHEQILALGGRGGLVAVDRDGNVVHAFNTPGMYRGKIDAAGNVEVAIFAAEEGN